MFCAPSRYGKTRNEPLYYLFGMLLLDLMTKIYHSCRTPHTVQISRNFIFCSANEENITLNL